MSPELVTHTLTVTTPTDINSRNTQSVAPSGDTNVTPSKPEAASNVSLDDLYRKPHKWRKRQNGDKNNPRVDYSLAGELGTGRMETGSSVTQDEHAPYTEISHTTTGANNRRVSSKVESALYAKIQPIRNGSTSD